MSEKSLGEKLWSRLEAPQGYAFIADDCLGWSEQEALERARNALGWHRKCVAILRDLVREYERYERDGTL